KFPELNPTIITAGQSRAVKDSRAVWLQRMPGSTREETASDPRVLVTTYGLSGVGLNLIRANYMLLVEPAWMKTRQVQAAGRCDREGQKAERTHIWLVYCKGNPADMSVLLRHENRAQLSLDKWRVTVDDE
ncbi:hypothetical protein NKR23_g12533, partial [Pleurostoma richardsiae]